MKLSVMLLGLMFAVVGNSFAAGEKDGGGRSQSWHITRVNTFGTGIVVASGSAVHLHSVVVTMGVAASSVSLFNGYSFAGAASGPILNTAASIVYPFDAVLSSGLVYTSTGGSSGVAQDFTLLWDWVRRTTGSWSNNTVNFAP